MMDLKDWISFFVGLFMIAFGGIPLLEKYTTIQLGVSDFLNQSWLISIFPYIVAIAGFYLLIESVREITNSSSVGWLSFWTGAIVMTIGLLPILASFGIGPSWFALPFLSGEISILIYRIIFIIEGIFLVIATFAMEI